MKKIPVLLIFFSVIYFAKGFNSTNADTNLQQSTCHKFQTKPVLPGAYQMNEYLPLLQGKRVAIFANQTSVVENTHLVDTLSKKGVNITKIFAPEHGFRGSADAGEQVETYTDKATGIQVVSLYGKKLKPSAADLKDVDVLLFDIQDVGVRFYTYISSLQYFLESAIGNDKPVIILDRPNPNGSYVDGPVLDTAFRSFIGMQPVPVVYGMTIGEYAQMLLSEFLKNKKPSSSQPGFNLHIIRCENYTHSSKYALPVKPSPNLPDMGSVYWYPSTCFFEGTVLSEGRGTDHPFQIFGHPKLPDTLFGFTPQSNAGAKEPKLKDRLCYGWNLYNENTDETRRQADNKLQLKWLLQAYNLFPDKENFFLQSKKANPSAQDYFFNKLAGNDDLMRQIKEGKTEEEIRQSWQSKLKAFKAIRKKYLLYEDFE